MSFNEEIQAAGERMRQYERQRFEAGELPDHGECPACKHIMPEEWLAWHVSEMHPDFGQGIDPMLTGEGV